MTWVLLGGGVALATVVAACAAALIEVFRQLMDIRRFLKLDDQPTPIALQPGADLTDIGLPSEVENAPAAIVVYLSTKCATCLAIAEALRGGAPETVWFIVPAAPHPEHLLRALTAVADRIVLDEDDAIADLLGLRITPAVLSVSFGRITAAHVVSSPRQLMSLIPTVFPADGGVVSDSLLDSEMHASTVEGR